MGQRRSSNIMVSVEPDLRSIIEMNIEKKGQTASSYLRKLAIDDLLKEGLLTHEMLLAITEG